MQGACVNLPQPPPQARDSGSPHTITGNQPSCLARARRTREPDKRQSGTTVIMTKAGAARGPFPRHRRPRARARRRARRCRRGCGPPCSARRAPARRAARPPSGPRPARAGARARVTCQQGQACGSCFLHEARLVCWPERGGHSCAGLPPALLKPCFYLVRARAFYDNHISMTLEYDISVLHPPAPGFSGMLQGLQCMC